MHARGVFTAVQKSSIPGVKVLHALWVYTVKPHYVGVQYKARLVARGDRQRAYKHFNLLGVFSTVLNNRELCLLFGCMAHSKWHVRQLDISQAFTYGNLDHELYLWPPEGSTDYDTGVV